ncbi:hypothetical protein BDW67DRAFT_179000 [Aspergillus spinulosporus]
MGSTANRLLTIASISRLPCRLSRHSFSLRTLFLRPASPVREFSLSNIPLLDSTQKLEEETLSWYSTARYQAYQHLNSFSIGDYAGAALIRKALDNYRITSAEGGMSLYDFRTHLRAKGLPEAMAGIVHTEKNIMMAIEDMSILTNFKEGEKSNPSPRKVLGDRGIYASRQFRKTKQHGRPILCDFGQARFGSNTYLGEIQPYIYRAPEAWDLFQQGNLFYARDSDKKSSDAHLLAEIIAFILEGNLEGKQQQLFLQFLRKMLKWQPEKRESARGLLDDPWLRST